MALPEGSVVHAHADGFGRWHATVQVAVPVDGTYVWDAARLNRIARRAILAEMRAREAEVSASRVKTRIEDSRHGYIHIREV